MISTRERFLQPNSLGLRSRPDRPEKHVSKFVDATEIARTTHVEHRERRGVKQSTGICRWPKHRECAPEKRDSVLDRHGCHAEPARPSKYDPASERHGPRRRRQRQPPPHAEPHTTDVCSASELLGGTGAQINKTGSAECTSSFEHELVVAQDNESVPGEHRQRRALACALGPEHTPCRTVDHDGARMEGHRPAPVCEHCARVEHEWVNDRPCWGTRWEVKRH